MLLNKWAEELRCRLLHRAAGANTVQVDGKEICFVWCRECDTVLASRRHGHDVAIREDFVADSLSESCEQIACRLAQSLPMTQANLVRVLGVRAELAEIERRSAERKVARWQSAAFAMLLLYVVLWLSGCLTATKNHRWESALLGWARKGGPECKEAVKPASKYLANANRTLQDATSAADVQSDQEAKKLMTEAAAKCGEVVP